MPSPTSAGARAHTLFHSNTELPLETFLREWREGRTQQTPVYVINVVRIYFELQRAYDNKRGMDTSGSPESIPE